MPMRVWRAIQTGCWIAGWCCIGLAAVGAIAWLTGGDVEHGTAGGKLLVLLGVLGAAIGLTIGHRNEQASMSGPA
jgi:hypothetical protein